MQTMRFTWIYDMQALYKLHVLFELADQDNKKIEHTRY